MFKVNNKDIRTAQGFELVNVDWEYYNSYSKFQLKNTQIRHFWAKFEVLHETLRLDKVAFADSRYDNIFQIYSQKVPI